MLACLLDRLYALPIFLQPLSRKIFHTTDAPRIRSYALFYVTSSAMSTLQTDSPGYFFRFFYFFPFPISLAKIFILYQFHNNICILINRLCSINPYNRASQKLYPFFHRVLIPGCNKAEKFFFLLIQIPA